MRSLIRRRIALGLGTALCALATAWAADTSFSEVEQGRYLATAGDCAACHTAPDGAPFAGGLQIETPFGVIYSPNITPDRDTGIGAWTEDQFYRAMHEGIAADGERLYPAFPYPYYTKVTREDVDAIYAYLRTLEPVRNQRKENELTWPLNYRVVMRGWNELFFEPGEFRPEPSKSAAWNRGAYLVEGLGHCGACHTPWNLLGAAQTDDRLHGGNIQEWFAPSLSGDLRRGLGAWSEAEIVTYLKTGRNARTVAYGPMAEVIEDSTAKLTDDDLEAIATYLKDAPPAEAPKAAGEAPERQVMSAGEAIYVDQCAACHHLAGEGVPGIFPALKGGAVTQSADPTTVIRLILQGGRAATTDARPTPFSMPPFGWKLSDAEVAAVATYVRHAWGNAAPAVSAGDVGRLRDTLQAQASRDKG